MLRIKHSRGLNLIELLISLGIVVILATIVIPSYMYYLQTNRLIGAANHLYYQLQYARTEAVKRNTPVYVSLQTGSNWCYGINPGAACSCSSASSCTLGTITASSASGLSMSATGIPSSAIRFESNHGGAGSNSTITFTISGQTDSMTVKVGMLGSLQICSDDISGYQPC